MLIKEIEKIKLNIEEGLQRELMKETLPKDKVDRVFSMLKNIENGLKVVI
ncbi:hypothetical protein [Bacillus wiedmannii]|nr:hypothetical protein [Bacillus wiedmannii]